MIRGENPEDKRQRLRDQRRAKKKAAGNGPDVSGTRDEWVESAWDAIPRHPFAFLKEDTYVVLFWNCRYDTSARVHCSVVSSPIG